MSGHIALLQPIAAELEPIIAEVLPPGFTVTAVTGRSVEDLKAAVRDADYAVWWDVPVTAEILAAGPRLKLLHKWGVGIDNIDLEACRARGIQVARTTGSNAGPVAEFTIGVMIALARRIVQAHISTAAGGWEKNEVWKRSIMVSGKTVGIVGLGSIGKGVAQRLAGFEGHILYHNRHRLPPAEEQALGVAYRSLDALLAESDIVTLHCPLSPETRGMIDARAFGLMKRGALLVNVARGGVVVEADLIEALRNGTLAGAAVDVFDAEPPPPDHPLLHMDNVIVTPHSASTAFENSRKGIQHWLGNIARVARGEQIPEQDRVA
ncbi:2-hydroxyacid dehydrogenase [Roseomonas sp. HJA6]|uniref:2-hydroxyacid dehydrogenase n=1 Tax=Roseomonas alba TaxID=2846776 RepID=A0ABS7A941_9PROT|nr:2-hydroxyacid dehydrogenase [Neoroseomonas alba]MBW6398252.1 2-hydroxyacid dehydrogenase [Neoroseomonas alba]